jgi:hypothetical protein
MEAIMDFLIHRVIYDRVNPDSAGGDLSAVRCVARVERWGGLTTGSATSHDEDECISRFLKGMKLKVPPNRKPKQPLRRANLLRMTALLLSSVPLPSLGYSAAQRLDLCLALKLGYIGMLRVSELVKLNCDSVCFHSGTAASASMPYAELRLRDPKTATALGDVRVVYVSDADPQLPVLPELRALIARQSAGGVTPEAALFSLQAGRRYSSDSVNSAIKALAAATGQGCFTAHSLRHGGCTDLLDAAVPLDIVLRQGRWRSIAWLTYRHPSSAIVSHMVRLHSSASSLGPHLAQAVVSAARAAAEPLAVAAGSLAAYTVLASIATSQ